MRWLRRHGDFRGRKDGQVLSLPWLRLDCYTAFWKDMSVLHIAYSRTEGLPKAVMMSPVPHHILYDRLPVKTDLRTVFGVLIAPKGGRADCVQFAGHPNL
jgi:hypothetical protein